MKGTRIAAGVGAASILVLTAVAAWAPALAQSIPLSANRPAEAATLQPVGHPAAGAPLLMEVTLGLRNHDALNQLLEEQQDPRSPYYHRWLSPAEFNASFGPTASEFGAVGRWLTSQGFTIVSADSATRSIQFTGPVVMAERAFETKLATFGNGSIYSNISDPMIPLQLAGVITAIHGLDNMGRPYALGLRVAHKTLPVAPPSPWLKPLLLAAWPQPAGADTGSSQPDAIVSGSGPSFGPADLQTFYDETPLLKAGTNGSGGDCIAVVGNSDFLDSAISLFNSTFGLPPSSITRVLADRTSPGATGDEFEALWDQEWVHAVAPGAAINFYLGNDATAKVDAVSDAINRAISDNTCGVINISFGFCGESSTFYSGFLDPLFVKAAAQGQSVFVAQGDAGAADAVLDPNTGNCVTGTSRNVNEMGADPNVTAVGGTQFTPAYDASGNDVGSVPETVWNDSSGAGGGGASTLFPKPAYQNGVTPADGMRDVPDIAGGASRYSPGFFVADDVNGKAQIDVDLGYGTSLSAPMWAGLTKLLDQVTRGRAGNINPRLYQLGALGGTSKSGIRDVTTGNNNFNGVTGFNATAGYDQASGWGTPDMNILVSAFQPGGVPTITSTTDPILVGASFTVNGSNFTPGSVANFFVSTSTGPVNEGPLKNLTQTPTKLTFNVPATVALGEGFVEVRIINTDRGYTSSNLSPALLQGSPQAGIPSLTSINATPLAATSSNPSFATNNVETVVLQGSTVELWGTGFDTTNGIAVDLFCACTGGKIPTVFLNPGNAGLTDSTLTFTLPPAAVLPTGPGAFVISNRGADGNYSKKSNAVSVPIGQKISVTSVTQSGSTITVDGAGFSTLTVINFFNRQGTNVVNLGGLGANGTANIPLTVKSESQLTFSVPSGAQTGPAYVQAFNPPFVPFTSSGSSPGGALNLQ